MCHWHYAPEWGQKTLPMALGILAHSWASALSAQNYRRHGNNNRDHGQTGASHSEPIRAASEAIRRGNCASRLPSSQFAQIVVVAFRSTSGNCILPIAQLLIGSCRHFLE
jgi:hypothetical protein